MAAALGSATALADYERHQKHFHSFPEAKTLANFVTRAGGRGETFVKNEFLSQKVYEVRLTMDPGFQFIDVFRSTFGFRARQSDVGMVRTGFGHESAPPSRCRDILPQRKQFWRKFDTDKENSGTTEEVHSPELNTDRRRTDPAESHNDALELLSAGIAEKLQGDMPSFWCGPAEIVSIGPKSHRDRLELVDHPSGKRNSYKKAHRGKCRTFPLAASRPWEGYDVSTVSYRGHLEAKQLESIPR